MTPRVRCAIYTRKSSEEGLEQDFNSLDAQREACEAYIKSQRGMGWSALATHYDDGGISGGTLARPALQQLLTDIDEGKVDLVVVYKVDRLTRSLADFAKIVERFEARGASFVSVTQQFNTSTSMGRLTLNVLLSFAQFEREVTGERIRDKVAASKKKGMWMGGQVPLGFDLNDKKLVINPAEAKVVRALFALYLELGTVNALLAQANRQGLVSKLRKCGDGRTTGGKPFTRGHLYQLLGNPLYAGDVAHKGQVYLGQHNAIIDRATFDAVQQQLCGNAVNRRSVTNSAAPHLLTSLVYDANGERLSPTQSNKKGKRYHYYTSKRLADGLATNKSGWRLPAKELDRIVVDGVAEFLRDKNRIIDTLSLGHMRPDQLKLVLSRAEATAAQLADRKVLRPLLDRVTVAVDEVKIDLKQFDIQQTIAPDEPGQYSESDAIISLNIPTQLRRRGVETKLIIESKNRGRREPDSSLITAVAQAHTWWDDLTTGKILSIKDLVARDKIDSGDLSRTLALAFLAPDIVEAILDGRQPVTLTTTRLKRIGVLPLDWPSQRQKLGFAP